MLAPQSNAIQTTGPSTPASKSPQWRWSVMNASRSVNRLTAGSLPQRTGLVPAFVLLGLLGQDRPDAAAAVRPAGDPEHGRRRHGAGPRRAAHAVVAQRRPTDSTHGMSPPAAMIVALASA
jgi:hypothetical protein